jgi:methenyltetrahydromethanopterin cyclohydrolase
MAEQTQRQRADLNTLARPLVRRMIDDAAFYRVELSQLDCGTTIIDAGIKAPGGLEAGRCIAEICLGGLGRVGIRASDTFSQWRWHVDVYTGDPVIACLASQYAGWSLNHGEGKTAFRALGSGPARSVGSREPLFEELGYRNPASETSLVLEVDSIPPVEIAEKIASYCKIDADKLTLILTPTSSLAGSVQIVARVLEVALHKVHELKFPLDQVIDGAGSAPIPPPSGDFLTAMGRTNDAILFGGHVQLFVDAGDDEARQLADDLPSMASRDFGKPFSKVFKDVEYDFYKIDPMLFSPASVAVTALKSGHTYRAGELRADLLDQSFGS